MKDKLVEWIPIVGGILILLFLPLIIWFIWDTSMVPVKLMFTNLALILFLALVERAAED